MAGGRNPKSFFFRGEQFVLRPISSNFGNRFRKRARPCLPSGEERTLPALTVPPGDWRPGKGYGRFSAKERGPGFAEGIARGRI